MHRTVTNTRCRETRMQQKLWVSPKESILTVQSSSEMGSWRQDVNRHTEIGLSK